MPDRARAIINQALIRISETPVDDLETTEQPSALSAMTLLETVMDEAVSEWEWSFATKFADLTPTEGVAPAPEDMVRILEVRPKSAEWRVIGREIHIDEEEPTIVYVGSLVEWTEPAEPGDPIFPTIPSWLSPKFQIAVACRLAAELAPTYAGNLQLASQLQQEYMVLIRQARSQDSLGSEGPDEKPEDWREVR